LPSKGIATVLRRLIRSRGAAPLILNIAGFSIREFKTMLEASVVLPNVIGVELNISCPLFEDPAEISDLLRVAKSYTYKKLIMVKLSPRHSSALEEIALLAEKHGVGLTLYNTYPVKTSLLGAGRGGLSGLPLYRLVLEAVARVKIVAPRVPLVCVGGIFTGRQVMRALMLGCDAVGVLTALVYRGPNVFEKINRELLEELRTRGFASVNEAKSYMLEKVQRSKVGVARKNLGGTMSTLDRLS
jgi:dihydroorotate dehydrogenase (NAD+) catalytic subunit